MRWEKTAPNLARSPLAGPTHRSVPGAVAELTEPILRHVNQHRRGIVFHWPRLFVFREKAEPKAFEYLCARGGPAAKRPESAF